MASLMPKELSLDCDLSMEPWIPKTIREFITEVSGIHDVSERIPKLDDYLSRMQNEMKKIDAFKRELPLCMLLLNDAIATMKEEVQKCEKSNVSPVLEEFIRLKNDEKDDKVGDPKVKDIVKTRDNMNWLSSVQLWSSDNLNPCPNTKKLPSLDTDVKRKEEAMNRAVMDDLFSIGKNRTSGMAFAPLNRFTTFPKSRKEGRDESAALTLRTPEIENLKEEIYSSRFSSKSSSSRSGSSSATNYHSNMKPLQQQTTRKQRRCWSPELHRRFVNALQHLGGAQAATPKQIRELMQVDGLTNDEVKSHLQKYRIHTQRVPPATNSSTAPPVVLRGLWNKPSESSRPSNSQSCSPQGPIHLTRFSRGTSMTGGDSVEEGEDDERSDSQSWKSMQPQPLVNEK